MTHDRLVKDVDGREFYLGELNPFETFNRIEITLSHLFREKMPVLSGRNYSDCLWDFVCEHGLYRPNVIEVGCGLGDLALNVIQRASNMGYPIESYVMYDISESLLNFEQQRLRDMASGFVQADCLDLSRHVTSFGGLIISNAMIADLRSVIIGDDDRLSDYGIEDKEIEDFLTILDNNTESYYLHIGTLLFLRQLSICLESGGVALILEYAATPLNQPSFFQNHYECGIDFNQVASYARRLGFAVDLVDIEQILGIARDQEFLSVDVFTSQDRVALKTPRSVKLWQARKPLPVLAYTRSSFSDILASPEMGFTDDEANDIVESLEGHFHSVHDPRFDSRNPTTWGYRCLILRKKLDPQTDLICERFGSRVIRRAYAISERDAKGCWKSVVDDPRLGFDPSVPAQFLAASILSGVLYDLVKMYGIKVWRHFAASAVRQRLRNSQLDKGQRDALERATVEELESFEESGE